jgi:predicted membrane chloride channel (bestrophin family)
MIGRVLAKIIVSLLTIYCISVIVAYFYNISITFPFFLSEGTHVPEHRLKAIRLSLFATFTFFAFHYLFYGSKKFYPVQVMAVMIFSLTIFGTLSFSIEEAEAVEFLQLLVWVPVSLVLYKAQRLILKIFLKNKPKQKKYDKE